MMATRNNLRAATAALSGAAIILLAAILLAIRPVPAFAEGDQVVLDMPTDVPCAVKADGSVVAPSPEVWTINNVSSVPVILGGVTITPGTDAGPIGLSACATPYSKNSACGDQFDWFSYGRGQDADRPSAEQTLEAGNSLQVAWSIDKLDSVKNRKAIDGSTKADGFALANIQFSFMKKEQQAFAVIYDVENGGRAAKLYKRYDVPKVGTMFGDDKVAEVITGIENKKGLFSWANGLTAVKVVDDGIQPSTTADWFAMCSDLKSVDLSKLSTSSVTDMHQMFFCCSGLESLDVSSFNTAKVTNMIEMFSNCNSSMTVVFPSNSNSKAKLQKALSDCGITLSSSQSAITEDANSLSASDSTESRQLGEGVENRSFEPVGSKSLSGSTASAAANAPSSNVGSAGKTEADSPGQFGGSESKEPSAEKADNCQPDSDGNLSSDKSGSSAHMK